MWRSGKLSSRILASVVTILVASSLVGFGLNAVSRRAELQRQYQFRALAIAQTFAAMPPIREGLARHDAADRVLIQRLAQEVRQETGASYIVVVNRSGIRFSHPDRALIGQRVTEPVVALDGRDHLSVDHGSLGASANAKVPLRAPSGQIIGEVSAGIPEARVTNQLLQDLPRLGLFFIISLAIGVVASLWLTRRLKQSTFGLELEEIASLVHEREAMLHNIREGVITLDRDERITLINDEARRLLAIGGNAIGERIGSLIPSGRLLDLLTGRIAGQDQVVLTDEHILVVNRVLAAREHRRLGAVVTLRDRSELEALIRELDGVEALTSALRAQQHEFSNRMHTVAGLIELGDHAAAAEYALEVSIGSDGVAERIRAKIERPEIAAMVLAKMTIARERNVRLVLSDDSRLPAEGLDTNGVLTITGNLVDNAIDAAAAGGAPAEVSVRLIGADAITIEVTDSGPGVPADLVEDIFTDGFSTKESETGRPRGLGLALVQRLVRQANGGISIRRDEDGTVFIVTLPLSVASELEVRA